MFYLFDYQEKRAQSFLQIVTFTVRSRGDLKPAACAASSNAKAPRERKRLVAKIKEAMMSLPFICCRPA